MNASSATSKPKPQPCPICKMEETKVTAAPSNGHEIECSNCGTFIVTKRMNATLPSELGEDKLLRAVLSHAIRRMHDAGQVPTLDLQLFEKIKENESLPRPAEQANRLILELGRDLQQEGYGSYVNVRDETHRAKIGGLGSDDIGYAIHSLSDARLIELKGDTTWGEKYPSRLTFAGWDRYEQLKRTVKDSRRAFMAMKFGDSELNAFFTDHFKPAVRETGFELRRLDEEPRAGIIDTRMEVEIRNSRFLIADLTHGNQGAYWEAGFATALDKPVIYTCKAGISISKDTHFDVNHRLFVPWDPDNPDHTRIDLKATIRATLPTEAKMEDE